MSARSQFLRQILTDPKYQALVQLAEELIKEAQYPTSRRGKDQFDTTWKLAEEEGYVRGIRELLQRAEREAEEE